MTNYLSLQELVNKIEKNISQLEAGLLHNHDLETHLELVRDLYERTLILRYKAFESVTNVTIAPVETTIEKQVEEIQATIEEVETKQVELDELPTNKVEEPIAVATEIEFDFFSSNTEETIVATNDIFVEEKETTENQEVSTPTPIIKEEQTIQASEEQPIINEVTSENIIENTNTIEQQVSSSDDINTVINTAESTSQPNTVEKKIAQIKSKMNSQLGYYTISSLIGSFGLNERLLYINELFDGSSESFSDAIKQLDGKTNLSDATILTTELVQKFNWDIESDTVEEFFQKLCRRFA